MIRSKNFVAVPPGATIREQLQDSNMSQKEFAERMDMTAKHISQLINGEAKLSPDVVVPFEVVFGVPAKFWNNLEAIYQGKLIKAKTENDMENENKKHWWGTDIETRYEKQNLLYMLMATKTIYEISKVKEAWHFEIFSDNITERVLRNYVIF